MKKTVLLVGLLWLVTVLSPILLQKGETRNFEGETSLLSENLETDGAESSTVTALAEVSQDATVLVDVMVSGKKLSFPLDEYLAGVLAAEMPASFPEEALKAQVIAARSFILYRMTYPPSDGVHDGVPLCDDPGHCKAYRDLSDPDTIETLFGLNSETYLEKIRAAVRETDGLVLTYQGDPAMAAFHAVSGGMTESAEDVWGSAVPYLVEVESPGEEDAVQFTETVLFDPEDLRAILTEAYPEAVLDEDPALWLADVERSPAGMIKSASLGGVVVTGMELRMLLGLNSADFTWELQDGQVEITTTGYGHGVGMSQYGARAMALDGATCEEIVSHYYPGCEIDLLENTAILAED